MQILPSFVRLQRDVIISTKKYDFNTAACMSVCGHDSEHVCVCVFFCDSRSGIYRQTKKREAMLNATAGVMFPGCLAGA